MNKRKWIFAISAGAAILLVLVWFLVFRKTSTSALKLIPQNSIAMIEIHGREEFEKLISDNMWMELSTIRLVAQLSEKYSLFKKFCASDKNLAFDFDHEEMFAGVDVIGAMQTDYVFALELNEASRIKLQELMPVLNDPVFSQQMNVVKGNKIYEFRFDEISVSSVIIGNVLLFSTSSVLVESAVMQHENNISFGEDKYFETVYHKLPHANGMTIYIQLGEVKNYISAFLAEGTGIELKELEMFSSWIALQLKWAPGGITLEGIAAPETGFGLATIGKYTGESYSQKIDLVPTGTAILYQVNAENLSENIASRIDDEKLNIQFFDNWAPWLGSHYTYGITESLDGKYQEKSFLILPATDSLLAANKLKSIIVNDSLAYKGIRIIELNSGKLFSYITGAEFNEQVFGAQIKGSYIFANSINQLQVLLDAVAFGQTLRLSNNYKILSDQLVTNYNNSIYINFRNSADILKKLVPQSDFSTYDSLISFASKFPLMEIQFSKANDFYLVHGFIPHSSNSSASTGMLWQAQLNHPVSAGPFYIWEKSAKQNAILVQDTMNSIYLFSGGGSLIWEVPFEEQIKSDIHIVDFYGNGSSQMLFNTAYGIHLLDMRGTEVEGFPIELTASATSPISILYVNDDYRMYIACSNNNIYGFNKNGKPLTHWNPLREHMRVNFEMLDLKSGKENYLLIPDSNVMKVINENGKVAGLFEMTKPLHFQPFVAGDKVFAASEYFITAYQLGAPQPKSTALNSVAQSLCFGDINRDGIIDILYLDGDGLHAATSDGESIFDYAYTALADDRVQLFELENNTYPGIISPVHGRIFLFDSFGDLILGFPVSGSTPFIVFPIQGNQNVVVYGNNNFIYGYRIE